MSNMYGSYRVVRGLQHCLCCNSAHMDASRDTHRYESCPTYETRDTFNYESCPTRQWAGKPIVAMAHVRLCHVTPMIDPTENATFPKSTKSRNSDSSESCGTNSDWDFGVIWICTEEFEFCDLVNFGGVAVPVESVMRTCHLFHVWMRHATRIDMGQVTHVNELVTSSLQCRMYGCITWHIWSDTFWARMGEEVRAASHAASSVVCSNASAAIAHTWMHHVTRIDMSHVQHVWITPRPSWSAATPPLQWHTYECMDASRDTFEPEACRTYECISWYIRMCESCSIWVSQVTHINVSPVWHMSESCDTYKYESCPPYVNELATPSLQRCTYERVTWHTWTWSLSDIWMRLIQKCGMTPMYTYT